MNVKFKQKLKRLFQYIILLLFTLVLFSVFNSYLLNPFSNYILNNYAQTADGYLVGTYQDHGGNAGNEFDSYDYTWEFIYKGDKYTNSASSMGELHDEYFSLESPVPVIIEFWPHYPEFNRIEGDGLSGMWRMLGSGLIYVLMNGFILGFLITGWKDLSK